MSNHHLSPQPEPPRDGETVASDAVPVGGHGFWRNTWQVLKTIQARLRFIVILAAVGGVIVKWDTLKAHYEKWTRPLLGTEAAASTDTEYWCPMHPSIVRDHPDKCPICGMPLSQRKKSEAAAADEALPPGVVSRVTLTPYRVALAGVETVPVGYQPLAHRINTVGFVEFDERKLARISVRQTGKSRIDKLHVNFTGQVVQKGEVLASLYNPDLLVTVQEMLNARWSNSQDLVAAARDKLRLLGVDDEQINDFLHSDQAITHVIVRSPIRGHVIKKYAVEGEYVEEGSRLYDVADLSTVWIEAQVYEDEIAFLDHAAEKKLAVTAVTKTFPGREFKGEVDFVHPHLDASTRTLKVRFNVKNPHHELRPGMYATVALEVPATQLNLLPDNASAEQKEAYGHGLVLAVPERAVIDTGRRKIVYRQAEPDVFEGVEVRLGPRCGAFYPVIAGLKPDDLIATSGSFLIDAETRLTAGAASTYFGASGGLQGAEHQSATAGTRPSTTRDDEDRIQSELARLSPEDRRLVEAQGYCPIQQVNRLGSMGPPAKILVKGQPVFLCCTACVNRALANPRQTLDTVAQLKARPRDSLVPPKGKALPGTPSGPPTTAPEVRANLAKLAPEDRRLAEAQGYCPIEQDNLLGMMGPPVKILVKGQPVFLCCKSCKENALAKPDHTLAEVAKMKAKTAAVQKR